jgi:hypothetical protein
MREPPERLANDAPRASGTTRPTALHHASPCPMRGMRPLELSLSWPPELWEGPRPYGRRRTVGLARQRVPQGWHPISTARPLDRSLSHCHAWRTLWRQRQPPSASFPAAPPQRRESCPHKSSANLSGSPNTPATPGTERSRRKVRRGRRCTASRAPSAVKPAAYLRFTRTARRMRLLRIQSGVAACAPPSARRAA